MSEPNNVSLMRPFKAEFLLLCLLTPLSALQDTARKAWFPIAALVHVMGDKAVAAVDGLEKRGLPVKLHFWKCIEGLIPPDLEELTQYMGSSNVSLPMITKKAKQPKAARLWEHHLCHPDDDLVDPSRKTLAERARCEQSLFSKTHVTFKTYNRKAGVTDSKSLDGVMHITGMASGTPLHSTVANMLYCLIIVEVPKGHVEGIHSVVSAIWCPGRLFSLLAPLLTSWECWMVSESCTTTRG